MAALRDDFVMRQIDRLRAQVAGLLNEPRPPGAIDQALQLALSLQVKLFPVDASQFLTLAPAAQFEHLIRGRPEADAAELTATYAELLFHTATLYEFADRLEFASGARQLALQLALLSEQRFRTDAAARLVALLASAATRGELASDVQSLLADFERRRGPA